MSIFLREPNPGDRISANLIRDIIRAIKEQRPIPGPGIKLSRGPNGTAFSIKPSGKKSSSGLVYPWKVSLTTDDSGSQVLTVYLPYGSLVSDGSVVDIDEIDGKKQIETDEGVESDWFAVDLNSVSASEKSTGIYLNTERDDDNNIKHVLDVRKIDEPEDTEESDEDDEDTKDSSVLIATLKQTEDGEGNKLLEIDKQIVVGALVLYTTNITEGCFAIDKQWKLINTYFRIGTLITEIQFDGELTAGVWCIKIPSRIDPDSPSTEGPQIIYLSSILQLMQEQEDSDYVFVPLYVIEEKDGVKSVKLDMRSIPTAPMWEA